MTSERPSQTAAAGAAFVNREFQFTRGDFRQIAAMLHEESGIRLGDLKAPLVYARLVKRLRSLGLESFERYCTLVESPDGAEERQRMVAALTTNVTSFFRERHHFDHLTTELLPGLVDRVRAGARLRIWSAGCSTGEEPYSIALSILKVLPDAARLDVRVLATDINSLVLAHGARGEYDTAALEPVSRPMRAQWFSPVRDAAAPGVWRVRDELRELVSFRRLNLLEAWPMKAVYQAVFCRNVLIYFDEATRSETWSRIAPLLASDGRLYVGASERIRDAGLGYTPDGQTIYRRAGAVQ